jgi:hypothetical protein
MHQFIPDKVVVIVTTQFASNREASALQSLREQKRALAVKPNDLDQVAAAVP